MKIKSSVRSCKINKVKMYSIYDYLYAYDYTRCAIKQLLKRAKADFKELYQDNVDRYKFDSHDTPVATPEFLYFLYCKHSNNVVVPAINDSTPIVYNIIRKEYSFGEDIINELFKDFTIIQQYKIKVDDRIYFVCDWYIKELNLVIEFNEKAHRYIQEYDEFKKTTLKSLGYNFADYNAK